MKTTRLILLLIVACLFAAVPAEAQRHGKKHREKMRAELREFKLKYLAQEMELQPSEQPRFIELYDKMMGEKETLFRPIWETERDLRKNPKASEAEYEALATKKDKAKEEELKIDRKYEEQFSKFLTSKQIYKMKEAEKTFNKKVREMRHKKKGK